MSYRGSYAISDLPLPVDLAQLVAIGTRGEYGPLAVGEVSHPIVGEDRCLVSVDVDHGGTTTAVVYSRIQLPVSIAPKCLDIAAIFSRPMADSKGLSHSDCPARKGWLTVGVLQVDVNLVAVQ